MFAEVRPNTDIYIYIVVVYFGGSSRIGDEFSPKTQNNIRDNKPIRDEYGMNKFI